MPCLYHYLYTDILNVKEFNSMISKDAIALDFINKRTIKHVLNQAIIISLIISSLEIITRHEEIELLGLL